MRISDKTILQVFRILQGAYPEFEKKLENETKTKELLKIWINVFDAIEFDYTKNKEIDLIMAVNQLVGECKFTPSLAEIIERMRKIYNKRLEDYRNDIRLKIIGIKSKFRLSHYNMDKAIDRYIKLNCKYNDEQIIELVKSNVEKQKSENIRTRDIDEILKLILENEDE